LAPAAWHFAIEEGEVRLQEFRQADCLVGVGCHADQL